MASWSMRRFAILSLFFTLFVEDSSQGEFEKNLYTTLLNGYEALARPVENTLDPVNVSLGITLQQIVDIVEKEQIIVLNVWLTFVRMLLLRAGMTTGSGDILCICWPNTLKLNCNQLSWLPEEHGNVAEVRLPPAKIWKPDVLLYNSAGENFDPMFQSNVVVKNDGNLEWIPPGIIKATCKMDITWFPFDSQNCTLKYGSWTFGGGMLNLTDGEVNIATYTENGEWTLLNITAKRNVIKYDCCPDEYIDVTFLIEVQRRTVYYGFNLIIPCLLISFMTLLDFTLPPEAGEKLGLGVNIFLSLFFFSVVVGSILPQTSEALPLLVIYFSSIMIVVSASLVFTVLVLNIHHRSSVTHEMGDWFRAVFLSWLPWLLMMRRPGYLCTRGQMIARTERRESVIVTSIKFASKSLLANVLDLDDNQLPAKGYANGYTALSTIQSADSDLIRPELEDYRPQPGTPQFVLVCHVFPILLKIYRELKCVNEKVSKKEEEDDVANDWKYAAMVVDRLSLLVFTSVLIVSTCAILFSAPHIL